MNRSHHGRRAGVLAVACVAAVARTNAYAQAAAGPRPNDTRALADRVARAGDGVVRFRYAVRHGVCGDGARGITIRHADDTTPDASFVRTGDGPWRTPPCEPGPARATLAVRGGVARDVQLAVGGRWGDDGDSARVVDLGVVPAAVAAAYFLDLAARDDTPPSNRLLLGAVIADSSVVWPRLLGLARDSRVARATRQEATFWTGQYACDVITTAARTGGTLPTRADTADREVRKQIVFTLSQRGGEERAATLTRVARNDRDPAVRCAALFWLGQGARTRDADTGALALFAELLGRP